ncbi:hypothetical protein SNEBB_006306 [Seison nebaliae]|nr:hypothetical protein SNEBB_006306 [Seison nebaliae]
MEQFEHRHSTNNKTLMDIKKTYNLSKNRHDDHSSPLTVTRIMSKKESMIRNNPNMYNKENCRHLRITSNGNNGKVTKFDELSSPGKHEKLMRIDNGNDNRKKSQIKHRIPKRLTTFNLPLTQNFHNLSTKSHIMDENEPKTLNSITNSVDTLTDVRRLRNNEKSFLNLPNDALANGDISRKKSVQFPMIRKSNENTSLSNHHSRQNDSRLKRVQHSSLFPKDVLNKYSNELTPFEKIEIFSYKDIFYFGNNAKKLSSHSNEINHQLKKFLSYFKSSENEALDRIDKKLFVAITANIYNDEHGNYKKMLNDHISYRYEIIDTLGKGSFGQVLLCQDHKTGHHVAIKLIRNKKKFRDQGAIEVKILKHLKKIDLKSKERSINCVHIQDYFYFRNHLCISFEVLGKNLYEVLKSIRYKGFPLKNIRIIAKQILQCLSVLEEEKIIHCDLKPENILIVGKNIEQVKVIDFGSGCYESQQIYTYIQSRFYRAPEIVLGLRYTCSIDMWSFGCILCELLNGSPIFPGENEAELLAMIMECQGIPPQSLLDKGKRSSLFFDVDLSPRKLVNSKGVKRIPDSKRLSKLLKTKNRDFIDFVDCCLQWERTNRIKASEAFNHPWLLDI